MALGTVKPHRERSKARLKAGGGGRPPLDRTRGGGGGGGHGGGDGLPDYGERLRRYRLGLSIALVSIVTLFVCMGAAFLFRQGFATYDPATGTYIRDWRPLVLPARLLWLDTLILLASSATLELARRDAVRRAVLAPALRVPGVADDHHAFPWLLLTVALGISFLAGQALAWNLVQRQLRAPVDTSNSFFYMLTGTHALHVLAGLIALAYVLLLAWRRKPHEQRRVIVDVVSWYWHVIGALWIYLFSLLMLST